MKDCIANFTGATGDQADNLAKQFFRDTCVYKEDAAGEQRPSDIRAEDEVIANPDPPGDESPKVNKLALIVGLIASFITVLGVLSCCWKRCKGGKGKKDDPPPAYSP
ncbi:Nn.00g000110.m01.CDS01 [Neocucurbitaria sp. VM-36]